MPSEESIFIPARRCSHWSLSRCRRSDQSLDPYCAKPARQGHRDVRCRRLIWLDKHDIEKILSLEAEFALRLLKNVSLRFETLLHDIETVSTHSASERVADYLLKQPRQGTQTQLKFSKCLIASRLGLQAESLSRALQRLTKDHLISVQGSHVEILDEPGLLKLNHSSH